MAERAPAAEIGPLDGLRIDHAGTTLAALPPSTRLALHGAAELAGAVGATFGVMPMHEACRAASSGARAALWLGPDEWLLLAEPDAGAGILQALTAALAGKPHSLVDVSHRQTGIGLEGPEAQAVLNAGCPLDLDPAVFPQGSCTRTVFARAEITLWRTGAESFRIDVLRSFAPYLWQLLEEALREAAAASVSG
ncbi:MAG TPA: sarcosine oxidase subunit gamma family protein [Acetobacteraceae bacterium]|nr:sarcosine oxidase subunit gamma family protein [Acetobacteraceae bacterium]